MPYFTYLFLFLFSPPTAHFNGAMSRRAEYYTTCMNTCYYKSNFVPQLISKIEMAPKSFYIIQRTCFAFLFGLHMGKLPSFDTKFAAIVFFFFFFNRHNDCQSVLPAQMRVSALSSHLLFDGDLRHF